MIKVFVSGCYDILHGGHIEFFKQAKSLGDYLIVSVASDNILWRYKHRKPSMPLQHKIKIIEALSMVDEVVVGDDADIGLNFKTHFLRLKPDILAVTEDDQYSEAKKLLCNQVGTKYVILPKSLDYEKISTSDIIHNSKTPVIVPLRVDFAGGWLDVPKFAISDGYIINCSISPQVSLDNWRYETGGGLGGSAAYAMLTGKNALKSELSMGVGWQDPAIITETGLCVWRSGPKPSLDFKTNPRWLLGKMALLWMGKSHVSYEKTDLPRDYPKIVEVSKIARKAVIPGFESFELFAEAISGSYQLQLDEGQEKLPTFQELSKKYCGGGWGGYALYLFKTKEIRDRFLGNAGAIGIEPWLRSIE